MKIMFLRRKKWIWCGNFDCEKRWWRLSCDELPELSYNKDLFLFNLSKHSVTMEVYVPMDLFYFWFLNHN